jgi:flagellin-like hook-associated protein FlgL
LTTNTSLAELNYGSGVTLGTGAEFQITRSDGVTLNIDLDPSSDKTIGDVINKINAAGGVTARLSQYGNGIEIVDNAGGAGALTITKGNQSEAAWSLGLIPTGQNQVSTTGSPKVLTGADPNPQEVNGIFNTLIRFQNALRNSDLGGIDRAANLLDADFNRVTFARAGLGTKLQTLDVLKSRMDSEQVELKSNLSNEIEVDLPQAISDMVARQAALEASLRLTAQVFKMTLLNFL